MEKIPDVMEKPRKGVVATKKTVMDQVNYSYMLRPEFYLRSIFRINQIKIYLNTLQFIKGVDSFSKTRTIWDYLLKHLKYV